jgi:hypothetical protein
VGDPVASVWYRGVPAGVPRLDDLAEIRALGFTGVTWPLMNADGGAELRRLADIVGLAVVIRDRPTPRPDGAPSKPTEFLDLDTNRVAPEAIGATVWRAIAHGARTVSFDAGAAEGTGLSDKAGHLAPWVAPAKEIARQVEFNGQLIGVLATGPPVTIESPSPASLEVTMLDGDRSWLLVATNAGPAPVHAVARLLPGIPYALWLNLIDASTMSMLSDRAGPRWTFDLEAWGVRVYVIDKTLRTVVGGGLQSL